MCILAQMPLTPLIDIVYPFFGLDHGIGHLASMSPQKNERLLPSKG
jgi:hypothetical protein